MARTACFLVIACAVLWCAVTASGEVVRVTADQTTIYNAQTKESTPAEIKGKRFMVYGLNKDWYLVAMKIDGERQFRWLPRADVEVDWGKATRREARVTGVPAVSTLVLDDGQQVHLAGIEVPASAGTVGQQAFGWLRSLVGGKSVMVEYDDALGFSGSGLQQAYVYVDGLCVNRALVEYGAADVPEEYVAGKGRYASVFSYLAQEAELAGRGIWAPRFEERAPAGPTESSPPSAETTAPARQLTPAQLRQWAMRLQVRVQVRSERIDTEKDDDDEIGFNGPSTIGPGNGPWSESLAGIISAA